MVSVPGPQQARSSLHQGGILNHLCVLHQPYRCRIDLFDDSATTANYHTVRHTTPAVTAKPVAIAAADAAAVGATNSCPPLDSVTTLDTGCGPCARIFTADSN